MPDDPLYYDARFSGTVIIAGRRLIATGFVHDSNLSILALEEIPMIQVSELFDQFCGSVVGSSLRWPTEIVDLTLSGTSIVYSYVESKDFPPGIGTSGMGKGLFAASRISLSLAGHEFAPVAAQLHVESGKGFTIEGDWTRSVSLLSEDFLVLSGPVSGGPHLSLQSFDGDGPNSAKRGFRLNCAFSLFKTTPIITDLSITTDTGNNPPKLAATLTYPGTLGPFDKPSISFTWSQDMGFQLQNFPSISIPNLNLDFKSLLKDIMSENNCGKLSDWVANKIEQQFFAKPSVTTTKPAGAADGVLFVVINGYYKISAAGHLVVTVDLPQLALALAAPSQFSFDGVVDLIRDAIVDNAKAVVMQLWNDKAKLGMFMAAFAGAEALKKMASEISDQFCKALKELVEKFADALATAAGDLAAALAAAAGAIAGTLGGLCHSDDNGGGNGGGGGGGGASDGGTLSAALPPPTITRKAVSAGALLVEWSAVASAIGYEVLLRDSSQALVGALQRLLADPKTKAIPTRATIPIEPPALAVGRCRVLVKALADATGAATDSSYTPAYLFKLDAPENVTMSYDPDPAANVLTAQWSLVPSATGYEARVRNTTANSVVATATTIPPATFRLADFATREAGDYTVAVRALGPDDTYIPGNFAAATESLPMLAAPGWLQQERLNDRLHTRWAQTPGATSYFLSVTNLDAAKQAASAIVAAPAPSETGPLELDLSFASFAVRTGGRHQVSVSAIGDASHLGSGPAASPTSDVLFAGVGFTQVGSTFTVA